MEEKRYLHNIRWLVLCSATFLLLLFVLAWVREGYGSEWKKVQREYAALSATSIPGQEAPRGIFQAEPAGLNRTDRCVTCHNGIESPGMKDAPQPHAMHPGSLLDTHPVREYGCTICHGGQGRALNRKDAFGQLPETHWPHPLLESPFIQSSCGQCHLAIFSPPGEGTAAGMEVFSAGRALFLQEGCLGCHKARGVGGILGPDLTRQGEKTRHDYSFQHVTGEQTVSNWLKTHFRDPEMVSPGSQMLRIPLEGRELDALATFVMGLSKPQLPVDYFSLATLNEFKGNRDEMEGDASFATLCSGCHGKYGEGKSYETYHTGIPSVGNRDFIRVASSDFIRFTLEKGRSKRQMGSWERTISSIRPEELDRTTEFILEHFGVNDPETVPEDMVIAKTGHELFEQHCVACHGEEGRGGVAVALNQEGLLSMAGDRFIIETIRAGRDNTAMPGFAYLGQESLDRLLEAIRSWGREQYGAVRVPLPSPDTAEGALQFHFLCSRCHGEHGEGETGPAIINRDFLAAADDHYLYLTISRGRPHTAMFGWSSDVYNQERLERQDISSIIGFMRSEASRPLTYIYPGANPGNNDRGDAVFRQHCSSCHGHDGGGLKAPALNNQELLSAASNGYLMATITLGREGTAMPSWGYGQDEFPALSQEQREDLVAHIRSWQRIRIRF